MFRREFSVDGKPVRVVVDNKQMVFLRKRSFRGTDEMVAGNFSEWNDPEEFLDDRWFEECVLPALLRKVSSPASKFTIQVRHPDFVGWTTVLQSNDPYLKDGFTSHVGSLSGGMKATFVDDVPAPFVKEVTLLVMPRTLDGILYFILLNIRPGIMIPTFRADISRNRLEVTMPDELGLVFWEFGAPGDDEEFEEYDDDEEASEEAESDRSEDLSKWSGREGLTTH